MKTIKIFAVLLSIFMSISFVGFSQNHQWAQNIATGTTSSEVYVNEIITDNIGNVYTIGDLIGSADFDPSVANFTLNATSPDGTGFIQKLDANGNFVWAYLIGNSNSYSTAKDIKIDANSNIYIIGEFFGTIDFDFGTNSNNVSSVGSYDSYILKINTSGNFQFVKTLAGQNANVYAYSIAVDNLNNVVVVGAFDNTVDFDPNATNYNLTASGFQNGYALKLNSNGDFIWANQQETTDYSITNTVSTDANNNVYFAGVFDGSLDIDPIANANSIQSNSVSTDIFIGKYTAAGNFSFINSINGIGYETVSKIAVDNNSNIVLCGSFDNNITLGSFTLSPNTSNSNPDVFFTKLNSIGNFSWAKMIGGADYDDVIDFSFDNIGNIYATGYFDGSTDFDPGAGNFTLNSIGGFDVYLLKLKSNGDYGFVHQLGSADDDGGFATHVDNNYNIYATGIFSNTVDFDPSTNTDLITANLAPNALDIYQLKWSQCSPSTNTINASGCTYTLNGQTYNTNGTFTQIFTNVAGCDSVITVQLTGSGSNTILNPIVCGSNYSLNGQTYSSSGTYIQNYLTTNGCDSLITINLTVGNTTFSTINDSSCDFYLFNNNVLFNSGTFIDTIQNSAGCDSIITLNLTINQSAYNTLIVNTCGPYTLNGQTFTTSGFYSQYFNTINGCDSVVDLDLTITPIPTTNITQSSCNPITINGQTYSTSGNYTQLYSSVQGCDSTINLNITIALPNINITQTGALLTSLQNAPASYQWIKCNPYSVINGANAQTYTATSNGSYAVIVTANGCSDTSLCKTVNGLSASSFLTQSTQIFPNPVDNLLNIVLEKMVESLNIKITTITGQIIFESNYNNSKAIKIPTDNFSKGTYILYLNNGVELGTLKFSKE